MAVTEVLALLWQEGEGQNTDQIPGRWPWKRNWCLSPSAICSCLPRWTLASQLWSSQV